MRKTVLIVLALLLSAIPVLAESPMPENAVLSSETVSDEYRVCIYDIPDTGEQLILTCDGVTGEMLTLYGMCTTLSPDALPDADTAKNLLSAEYPDALVISSLESQTDIGDVLRLNVISPEFCGYVLFDANGICGRNFTFSECMAENRLTQQGAVAVLELLRPGAKITEIEFDSDDGLLLYEGESYVDGVEYEFEIDACTGHLLQWDRD